MDIKITDSCVGTFVQVRMNVSLYGLYPSHPDPVVFFLGGGVEKKRQNKHTAQFQSVQRQGVDKSLAHSPASICSLGGSSCRRLVTRSPWL